MKRIKFATSTRSTYGTAFLKLANELKKSNSLSVSKANQILKSSGGSSVVIKAAKDTGLLVGTRNMVSIAKEHGETEMSKMKKILDRHLKGMRKTRVPVSKGVAKSVAKRTPKNVVKSETKKNTLVSLAKAFSEAGDQEYALQLLKRNRS